MVIAYLSGDIKDIFKHVSVLAVQDASIARQKKRHTSHTPRKDTHKNM